MAATAVLAVGSARADSISMSSDNGFGRIVFTLAPSTHPTATASGGVVTVSFDRKLGIDPKQIVASLNGYVSDARIDADGKTLHLALAQTAKLHTSSSGNLFALDLTPQTFSGMPPDLPPPMSNEPPVIDPALLPVLPVRAGIYSNFSRLVFDWPQATNYSISAGAGRISITFKNQAKVDFSGFDHVSPPWVKKTGWHSDKRNTVVEFTADPGSKYHDFREGNRIVIDVTSPTADADTYVPPGQKGASASLKPIGQAAKSSAISSEQTTIVADTAKQLNQPAVQIASKAPDAKSVAPPSQPVPASAPAAVIGSPISQHLGNGIVLTFAGSSAKPAAIFVRGLTAWIVVAGVNTIDVASLKASLGDFSTSVDAQSNPGGTVLRIGLKRPEYVSAEAASADLKVHLSPTVLPPENAISFTRNDNGSAPALVAFAPGASDVLKISDPAVGDVLTVVPALVGRGVPAQRNFIDFQAIATSSGIVLVPLCDDLAVSAQASKVSIGRPKGLLLAAPSITIAATPSFLVESGTGKSYLDFDFWNAAKHPGILETERKLRDMAASQASDSANPARLNLAKFYLANRLAPEAFGVVAMMQSADPALQNDKQMVVMRAAAEYMMGRYKEAQGDLSNNYFDGDREAELWRGMIAARLEKWSVASSSLATAEPILSHYPKDWQARARIDQAEAALGINAPEMAEVALSHMPKDLPGDLFLASELARAKLFAKEGRTRDANALFAAVKESGNEEMEARAIYASIDTGLQSGTMNREAAIDGLESLRYRWRGDQLELNTLRKLGALYFQKQQWRSGFTVLHVASTNFPTEDGGRQAQDDMRGAFENLFIKGRADKLPPIVALGLFYDFVDLTPIGPNGDDMIRRMSDRLVAVDLLGPAATLLKYQITKRLDGIAQSEVAARLAMIDLMNNDPKDALEALRTTRIAGLPDDVNHQRMLLEARSLAALKQWDMALDTIAVDQADDTKQLRADIYWESGNWQNAGQAYENFLGSNWSNMQALSDRDRQTVMRSAISYSLANDQASLDRLRDHFIDKMKTSADANAFSVVTQDIDSQGEAFKNTASKIAAVNTLQSFMVDFKKRYDAPATN